MNGFGHLTWIAEQMGWGGICSGQREQHMQGSRGIRDGDVFKKHLDDQYLNDRSMEERRN